MFEGNAPAKSYSTLNNTWLILGLFLALFLGAGEHVQAVSPGAAGDSRPENENGQSVAALAVLNSREFTALSELRPSGRLRSP